MTSKNGLLWFSQGVLTIKLSVNAVNEYAVRRIEAAEQSKSIVPWAWFLSSTPEGALVSTFAVVMNMLANEMAEVLLQCDQTQALLDQLEHDLAVLHKVSARENTSVVSEKSALLAKLWTFLGGNRRQLTDLNERMRVLKDIDEYRTDAKVHVDQSATAVQTLGEDVEELRVCVAAPAILEDHIPIEVQIHSIQSGIERMRSSRLRIREQALGRHRAAAPQAERGKAING